MSSSQSSGDAASRVKTEGMAAYAAPSLFQPHNARQAVRDAHEKKIAPMLGAYYGVSSIPLARLLAPIGFDAVWVDWEHTSCNVETMTTIVHETIFMSQGRTIPWVRVPGHDHAAIGYALDCGASIVVPQVETVEQARHVVSAAKYGSRQNGTRSAPPFRLLPGITDRPMFGTDLHQSVNDQAAIMIQIETLLGIRNLDAILSAVPDIDLVWLGTLDARISMNLPGNGGMGGSDPEWVEAEALFTDTMRKHDKPRGGFAFGPDAVRRAAESHALVICEADVLRLLPMAESLDETRKMLAQA